MIIKAGKIIVGKELEVKDLFVLEKKHGTWQVSWHGVGK